MLYFGTFDPPHLGHLETALGAQRILQVDEVLLVANRWVRNKPDASDYSHRLAMTRALAYRYPGIGTPPTALVERACREGGPEEWVSRLRSLLIAEMPPGTTLFHVMGVDSFNKFLGYRGWTSGMDRLVIVVQRRDGYQVDQTSLEAWKERQGKVRFEDLGGESRSSTQVRARVRRGESLEGLVPSVIERYLARVHLYVEPD